jgi:Protein of unknown function (DUF3160)
MRPMTRGGHLAVTLVGLVAFEARVGAQAPAPMPPMTLPLPPPSEPPQKKPPRAWPLSTMHAPAAGATTTLGAGETLVQMEIEPRGGYVALVVRAPNAPRATLRLWNFQGAPTALEARELRDRSVEVIAFSPFDGSLFVASAAKQAAKGYRIDRFAIDKTKANLRQLGTVFASEHPINALVTGLVEYDGQERLFFGLETVPRSSQIVSVRADGTGVYELTSSSGTASDLTDVALRGNKDEDLLAPTVEKAASAIPLSLGPDGTLIWRRGDGALLERDYHEINWAPASVAVPGGTAGIDESFLANGYFRERWTKGQAGFELVNRKHGRAERVGGGVLFAGHPVVATNGRAFVGQLQTNLETTLRTYAMPAPGPAVRIHRQVWETKENTLRLERDGILLTPTTDEQIYGPYERLAYQELGCGESGGMLSSVFASLDGFFEVLNAGFEAVFVLAEQRASRPALAAVLKELGRVGKTGGQKRLVDVAAAAAQVLAGNLTHPEGALIKAGQDAKSALPINLDGLKIDYADFAPRGPYVATKALTSYFHAFKLMNQLQLSPEERTLLAGDAGFIGALRKWVDVQRPFLQGTRRGLLFDVGAKASDIPAACIPERVRKLPPLLFPLAWSLDSEILESSVARAGVGPKCGAVPSRNLPNGLDLLAGLGSAKARGLNADEYQRYPALAESQTISARRAAVLAKATTFIDSYLRMMQVLSTETRAPEAVSPDLWQRRLLQSALGSWVGLRHTLVLVSERGSAECDNQRLRFELLQAEPARGAVDPLPEAWRQIATLLDLLARHAREQRAVRGLVSQLHEQAGVARQFGAMAERQMRGEPLTAAEYKMIEEFGGAVEHPYLLFKSVIKDGSEGDIPIPAPMMKVVDLQKGTDGKIWHAAVGNPLQAVVLLGDRGVLVPATGAVYSYYEATAATPLDDAAWRQRLPTATQPDWIKPLLQSSRPAGAESSPPHEGVPGSHGRPQAP